MFTEFDCPDLCFKRLNESQGTKVRAQRVEKVTVNGTFIAIGPMYGPIIPVMKNIGVNDTMIARVDIITGGRTSRTARSVARNGLTKIGRAHV